MKLFKKQFISALQDLPNFLKASWVLLVVLYFPFEIIQQGILMISTSQNENTRLVGAIMSAVLDFIRSLVLICSIAFLYGSKKYHFSSLFGHWKIHLTQVFAEYCRIVARVILWSVAIAIPLLGFAVHPILGSILGVVFLCLPIRVLVLYAFSLLITQFNQKYSKNELDALRHSRNLTHLALGSVVFFVVLHLVLVFGLEVLKMRFSLFTDHWVWGALTILGFFIEMLLSITLYLMYRELEREKNHELTI